MEHWDACVHSGSLALGLLLFLLFWVFFPRVSCMFPGLSIFFLPSRVHIRTYCKEPSGWWSLLPTTARSSPRAELWCRLSQLSRPPSLPMASSTQSLSSAYDTAACSCSTLLLGPLLQQNQMPHLCTRLQNSMLLRLYSQSCLVTCTQLHIISSGNSFPISFPWLEVIFTSSQPL